MRIEFSIGILLRKCLFVIAILYFFVLIYQVIYGENGALMKERLLKKIALAQNTLSQLRKVRLEKQQKTKLLRSDSLDVDLLEEQARLLFGLHLKGEKQILYPMKKQPDNH